MASPEEIVEAMWTTIEAGDLDAFVALLASDTTVTMPGGLRFEGPDQVGPFMAAYLEGFPKMRHTVVDSVSSPSGDKIAVELRITMTHTGTFRTPMGDVSPTGKTVVVESVDMIKLAGGKIKSWHTYFDQLGFLAQLGLIPAPEAAVVV